MKKGLCIWLVCCMAITSLAGCGSKNPESINEKRYDLDNFTVLLDAGEYAKAAAMYQNTAIGNTQREIEIQNALADFAASVVKDYLEDRCDYDAANTDLDTVGRVVEQTGMELPALADSEKQLEEAKASKIAYDSGCELMAGQDYAGAIVQFQKVVQGDSHYADAQEQIQTAADSCKSAALTQAEAYAAEKDYDNALQTIEQTLAILPDDSDLKTKQATYSQNYITAAIAQADKALVDPGKDYEKAIDLLRPAMQKFPDDASLKEKYEYYMGFEPVSIFDMEPFTEDKGINIKSSAKDNMGNIYEQAFSDYPREHDSISQTYDIGKKYNQLTGIVSIAPGLGYDHIVTVKFYGDGQLLKEIKMGKAYKPNPFSIDITGVTDLKIEYPANGSGLNNMLLVADVTLQKTVK